VLDSGLITWAEMSLMSIPLPAALAAVALLGYMFGQRTRRTPDLQQMEGRRELRRARRVAAELEQIAQSIRRDLASHRASLARFKGRVSSLGSDPKDSSWQDLCREAEEVLKPTLRLATQISLAYDSIRQQSNQLMTFTEVRTDPLTGVSNRRALDESLENMYALMARYQTPFGLVLIDIDHFKHINDQQGHLYGDQILRRFARLVDNTVRDTDTVARYGGEEFVVIMPQTNLGGAAIFAERLRQSVSHNMQITVSIGVAHALSRDSTKDILSRADAALYSAKAAGRDVVFQHDGKDIDKVDPVILEALDPKPPAQRASRDRDAAQHVSHED